MSFGGESGLRKVGLGGTHPLTQRYTNLDINGDFMSAKQKLKRALSAIDDAQRALKRARNTSPESSDIRRALRELDDAESNIKRSIRELD